MATQSPGTYQQGRVGRAGNPLDYTPEPTGASTTLDGATVDSTLDGALTSTTPADGGSFDVDDATGFPTPPSTTLAADLNDVDGVATLTDASGLDSTGEFKVGSERIGYGSKTGNVLNDLTRGLHGTTVATHLSGATVRQPRTVVVGRERILYHTLSSDTLGDIIRHPRNAADHADAAVVGPTRVDIDVDSVAGFPTDGGRITIGNEDLVYRAIDTLTLQDCERASNGTEIEAHADAADVDLPAYTLLAADVVAGRQGSRPLYLPNRSGGTLATGSMVSLGSTEGEGGLVATTEGDPIIGLLAAGGPDDAWIPVVAGGYFRLPLDASHTELPGPGEPVFAASATTLKSLENADTDDEAVGYCLRTHDVDTAGTAVSPALVDVLMISRLFQPYTAS